MLRIFLLTFFCGLFTSFSSLESFAQDNYVFSHLDFTKGLTNNTVYELHQDAEGFLWIGAGPTLQRFDGSNYVNFSHTENDSSSLPFGDIRTMHRRATGELWIGTDGGGLVFFDGEAFKTIELPSGGELPSFNAVEQILEHPSGDLYIGSWDGGLVRVSPEGEITRMLHDESNEHTLPSNGVVSLYHDEALNRIWIGTWGGGLAYLEGDQITRVASDDMGFNSDFPRVITRTSDGTLWVGSWGHGLYAISGGKVRQYNVETGHLMSDNVLTLTEQGDKLWIGTWGGGLTLYEDGAFRTFRKEESSNSLSSDFIETVVVGKDDKLIIGTFGGGINFLSVSSFSYYDFTSKGFDHSYNFINTITEDRHGRIWLGTNAGILIENDSEFVTFESLYPSSFDLSSIYKLYTEPSGTIWIGGYTNVGLYKFDGTVLTDFTHRGEVDFSEFFIFDVLRTADSSVWVCTFLPGGLFRLQHDSVINYSNSDAEASFPEVSNFSSAVEVQPGEVWFSSNRNGVLQLKDGKFALYAHDDKNPKSLSNDYSFHLLRTTSGELWIGTEFGLNKWDASSHSFNRIYAKDGLISNAAFSLVEDSQETIWVGTDRGITRYDPAKNTFQNYDHRHGLQGYPFNRRSVFQSPTTGRLYFGGVNGLTVFDPSVIADNLGLQAKITNLSTSGQPSKLPLFAKENKSTERTLTLEDRDLNVQFSSMDLDGFQDYFFQYRLVGLDTTWIDNGKSTNVAFAQLPSGSHTFEVRSSADQQKWSAPASFSFFVPYQWWEQWWFIVLGVAVILVCVFMVLKLRVRYLEIQSAKLRALVERKTAALQKKNELVQQQAATLLDNNQQLAVALNEVERMKAQQETFQKNEKAAVRREIHDNISTTLYAIRVMVKGKLRSLLGENRTEMATEIDDLLAEVLTDSRIIMENLDSEEIKHISFYDSVHELVDSLNALEGPKITIQWEGHHQIADLKLASNLLRMLHEVFSNIFLHAKARQVVLDFKNDECITWTIQDDGTGFDFEQKNQSGISRIKRRAVQVNGEITFASDEVQGTKVSFHCASDLKVN